jgi:hypothetical protein
MGLKLIKLKMNPVWKLNFFLFNIEGYGEFFGGITPFRQKARNLFLMLPFYYKNTLNLPVSIIVKS